MLYHFFTYLDNQFDFIGAGVFRFYSFRTSMTVLFSLIITLFFGKRIINYLKRKQISDEIRKLGLAGEQSKQNTPTMGGIIILLGIIVPTLFFADLTNIYVILVLIAATWLGMLGFVDDYIKVFKKNKAGLAGKFKIFGQVVLGVLVGTTLFFHSDVVVRDTYTEEEFESRKEEILNDESARVNYVEDQQVYKVDHRSTKTTIPFIKGNEFDYSRLICFKNVDCEKWSFLIYIPVIILIIVFVSNGANLTDGLDGLNAGISAIVVLTLAIFAYVSGNVIFADYLNIMFIPHLGELAVFSGAMIGACIGFLWYNAYPAQVFMGDTGSLSLGGLIAILAIIIRKELLIPLLCGVFLIESLSVIIQVAYFKYTKKRYGEGRRIFKMSPLHHHYQKKDYPEPKIVTRFWIIGISLAILTFVTLKLR